MCRLPDIRLRCHRDQHRRRQSSLAAHLPKNGWIKPTRLSKIHWMPCFKALQALLVGLRTLQTRDSRANMQDRRHQIAFNIRRTHLKRIEGTRSVVRR